LPTPVPRQVSVPLLAERIVLPAREAGPQVRTPLELVRADWTAPPIMEPQSRSWERTPARTQVTGDRAPIADDPWPALPPPVVPHDADPGATLRAWQREERLDREQAGL